MAIEWTEDLATGVRLIDQQHREIFRRTNALLEASARGEGQQRVADVIQFLASYVVGHFGAEEKYMQEARYPGYVQHKQQHAAFLAQFGTLRRRFEKDGASLALTLEVQRGVVDWLLRHIKKDDKALGAFLKERVPTCVG